MYLNVYYSLSKIPVIYFLRKANRLNIYGWMCVWNGRIKWGEGSVIRMSEEIQER